MVRTRHLKEVYVKNKKTKRAAKLPPTRVPPTRVPPKKIFVAVDRSSGRVRVADANRAFVERWTMGMERLYAIEQYAHVKAEQ
jgi:hypothetical protein